MTTRICRSVFAIVNAMTLALLTAACGPAATSGTDPIRGATGGTVANPSTGSSGGSPGGSPGDVIAGNTRFALDMYAQLRQGQAANLFFSPASISTALAMTYAGARGQTEAVMAKTMHFDVPQEQLHATFRDLIAGLQKQPDKSELTIANRLWGEKSWKFANSFLATTRDHYGAELKTLDFRNDPDGSRQTINKWIEDRTRNRIRELLQKPNVKPDTRLILTNAVYFKAPWRSAFEAGMTQPVPFYLATGEQRDTPMMRQVEYAGHGERHGVQVLEKGYEGGTLSMVVLLPEKRDGLADLEKRLDAKMLAELLSSTEGQKVDVWLPRFKFEQRVELAKTFKQMGMALAFSDDADFSGMTGNRDLKIDDVIHKAFIAVYEEGTEAAAATAVVMAEITSAGPRPEPKTFRADHPFLFLIRDQATGTILFMGRLSEPTP